MTPLVRLISSNARRISGFCCSARITACSSLNLGEPCSDQPKLATSSVGGGDGGGTIGDGPPRLVGTETVPASVGVIVAVTLGIRVGVVVDTSIGVGCGVSGGVGVCASDNAAAKNAARPNPATKKCFCVG